MTEWIPEEKWEYIVRHLPIPSVDILVQFKDGVLFGRRQNEPAEGEWFVPGGRIRKGEQREEAVHRIAKDELDLVVQIVECLGTYEHIYEYSEFGPDIGKHYLASGYVVTPEGDSFTPDDQHSTLQIFQTPPDNLHEHIQWYLDSSNELEDWWEMEY